MAIRVIKGSTQQYVANKELKAIEAELTELFHGPQENEYGILRPTNKAFEVTMTLLARSASYTKKVFPYGAIAPDGEGGLSIEWYRDRREVRLVVSSNPVADPPYAYWQSQDQHDLVEGISPMGLAELLDRYIGD